NRLHSILTEMQDVVWSVDEKSGQLLYISPSAERVYGRKPEEFYTHRELWLEAIYPPDRQIAEKIFEVLPQKGAYACEYRIVRSDGEIRWISDRSWMVRNAAGESVRVDGLASDITERKRVEGLLNIQTRVLERIALGGSLPSILNEITVLVEAYHPKILCSILLLDDSGTHLHCTAAASFPAEYNQTVNGLAIGPAQGSCGTAAYRKETVIVSDIAHDPLWVNFREIALKHNLHACWSEPILATTGQVLGTLAMYYRECRSPKASELAIIQAAAHLAGIAIERKRAEGRLMDQAALLNQAQDAIISLDLDERVLFWNAGAEQLYGWSAEEVLGQSLIGKIYWGDATYEHVTRELFGTGKWKGELHQFTKNKTPIIVDGYWRLVYDEDGAPKFILGVNHDITERKRLEAQFLRTQRLESIGTLASGIAHDLNNVLSPMTISVYLLRLQQRDQVATELLDGLDELIERGANMVKQVVSFARGSSGERVVLNPKHVLRELVSILKDTFPKSITINYQVETGLQAIWSDPTQLHQVLMNLCVNARDAMLDGGTLTISAQNAMVDKLHTKMATEAQPGKYVTLTVADTGIGIAPEIRSKIFEPFFTTKEPGKGTGLGLATVQNLVRGHSGFIDVYSEIGNGTQFKIYFPVATGEADAEVIITPVPVPQGHGECILVVDDEPTLRKTIQTTLEASGYCVVTAADGAAAATLFAEQWSEIDLVLTDMMMPEMEGPAMVRALQTINPNVSVIASSGLADGPKLEAARQLGAQRILLKPYSAEELLQAVAAVLSNGRAATSG
ncbi:MAG TPA: PAS domain S-box protein, partial [Blastocatellia bacterium]|nr:PAS domain S-box protein [Blastocatellia bacterium]